MQARLRCCTCWRMIALQHWTPPCIQVSTEKENNLAGIEKTYWIGLSNSYHRYSVSHSLGIPSCSHHRCSLSHFAGILWNSHSQGIFSLFLTFQLLKNCPLEMSSSTRTIWEATSKPDAFGATTFPKSVALSSWWTRKTTDASPRQKPNWTYWNLFIAGASVDWGLEQGSLSDSGKQDWCAGGCERRAAENWAWPLPDDWKGKSGSQGYSAHWSVYVLGGDEAGIRRRIPLALPVHLINNDEWELQGRIDKVNKGDDPRVINYLLKVRE